MKQQYLFDKERRKRRVMMHVENCGIDICNYKCLKCGHESGWIEDEGKRKIPCPKCNKGTK